MKKYLMSKGEERPLYLHCNQRSGVWEVKIKKFHTVVFEGTLDECQEFMKTEEEIENGGLPLYF